MGGERNTQGSEHQWTVAWMKETNWKTYVLMAGYRSTVLLENLKFLWKSRYSTHFMTPKASSPRSQEPATCPYLDPDQFSQHPFPNTSRTMVSSHLRLVFQVASFCQVFCPKTLYAPLFPPHTCYIHRPFNSAWFDHSANICWVKATPLLARKGPEGSRRSRLPDFKTIGIWKWQGCQPYAPAAFTPGNIPGTHFGWGPR